MEWLKELLEKAKVTDGKLDIESLMKLIQAEFPKHAVPKSEFNAANLDKKKLESDLKERDGQLETLKASTGDSVTMKKQIEDLQGENEKAKKQHEDDMKNLKLESAIKLSLTNIAHDVDLVAGLFDKEKLMVAEDGKVLGLEEQLKTIKESKEFLFKKDESDQGTGGQNQRRQEYNPKAGDTNTQSLAKTIAESMNKEANENPYAKAWG